MSFGICHQLSIFTQQQYRADVTQTISTTCPASGGSRKPWPLYASYMTFTPYIAIYAEGHVDPSWYGDHSEKAILIFSKNLDYNKALSRKRVNIHLGDEERIDTNNSIKSIWVKTFLILQSNLATSIK
jgi:hypothetical protein